MSNTNKAKAHLEALCRQHGLRIISSEADIWLVGLLLKDGKLVRFEDGKYPCNLGMNNLQQKAVAIVNRGTNKLVLNRVDKGIELLLDGVTK